MSTRQPKNGRSSCRDCQRPCMSLRPTKNTKRLRAPGVPFCTECVRFWKKVEDPSGDTWNCLECKEVMPFYEDSYGGMNIDWAHKETCDALHNPCKCKIRNKEPGKNHCSRCIKAVYKALNKSSKQTSAELKSMWRRPNPTSRQKDGPDPSPWGENAVRSLEGD